MNTRRYYRGKAVNFILLAKVICIAYKEHIDELKAVSTDFTLENATALELDIDTIAGKYLGNTIRDRLYAITFDLTAETKDIKIRITTLRTHLETNFKRNPRYELMLGELGLEKSIYSLTQPQLIDALSKLVNTLTPSYITTITAGGMPAALPQGIATSAKKIVALNFEQETIKGNVKEAIGKMRDDLNELYSKIIKICKLASNFYRTNPEKKSLFTYSKVMKHMGQTRTSTETPPKTVAQ